MIDYGVYEILCCGSWLPAPDPGSIVICPHCETVWGAS